ncbi:MAG: carboxypeptidase Q [Rhodothermales bacterium]|jgi:carboxypeptidase Q
MRLLVFFCALLFAAPATAQVATLPSASPAPFPTGDPVLEAIWNEAYGNSHLYGLAQTLADSLGPRLTGSPTHRAAVDWAVERFQSWGIEAEGEQYGTWRSWERGISHVDLLEPRVRSLEAMLLPWGPGTSGPATGGVAMIPELDGAEAFRDWLPQAKGKFILLSAAEASCRPADVWDEVGREGASAAFREAQNAARSAWSTKMIEIGLSNQEIVDALEEAGAAGFLVNLWTGARGTDRIFPLTYSFRGAMNRVAPAFNLSCEDYGLVYRLAEHGDAPILQAQAQARDLGEGPVFNVVASIRGTELPDEYVLLSAHYDAWDGGSGMTDNGTGSVTMMEALRILKKVYPNPRRTIMVGLWGGEEQGLNGSRAFSADHPEIVEGLQILLNQDNGTGRISSVSTQGLVDAGGFFADWFSRMPSELVGDIDLNLPGSPGSGGSDYASFICAGAPSFSLSANRMDYFSATWHTNRDTFDKVAWDDLTGNAAITAMLAYQASEDDRIPRTRRQLAVNAATGSERPWPVCQDAARETSDRFK